MNCSCKLRKCTFKRKNLSKYFQYLRKIKVLYNIIFLVFFSRHRFYPAKNHYPCNISYFSDRVQEVSLSDIVSCVICYVTR